MREPDPEVQAFMRRVMEAIGVDTAGELINLLAREGVFRATELRKAHRWVSGESAPNHKATLRLLERAGLLDRASPADEPNDQRDDPEYDQDRYQRPLRDPVRDHAT